MGFSNFAIFITKNNRRLQNAVRNRYFKKASTREGVRVKSRHDIDNPENTRFNTNKNLAILKNVLIISVISYII